MNKYDLRASALALDKSLSLGWPDSIGWLYKPFDSINQFEPIHWQSLGWSILDPNSRVYFDPRDKNGFKELLMKGHKFTFIDRQLKLIDKYCQERIKGELTAIPLSENAIIPAYYLRCERAARDGDALEPPAR